MNRSGRSKPGADAPIHAKLEQCIRDCDDRTGLKIVVAPSSHAARMLRAALARQGCPLVNVEALTPAELAGHVVRTMAPDDRRRTMSRAEGAFLIRRLTDDLRSDAAELLGRAAFPVWSAVQELRASGVQAADVARAARRPHERILADLHAACDAHLRAEHLRDSADIMLAALDLADEFARRRAPELVAVLDQVRLSGQEERLVRIIAGAAGRRIRIGSGALSWSYDRAASVLADWSAAGGAQERIEARSEALSITAGERREEVASVLADIVGRGIPFDDVEVAWTSEDPYRSEIRAACGRYGIPFTETDAQRVIATPVGASVVAALRWVSAGYPVDGLVSMLRTGYIRPPGGEAARIAAVLDRFPVSLAQAARSSVRTRLFERARQEFVDIRHLTDTFRLMDALRRIAPLRREGAGSGLVGFVESFLLEHAGVRAATDELAALILSELAFLDGPAEQNAFEDVAAAAAFAVQILERLPARSSAEAGGLTLLPLEDAGFGRASHVYVVGLDDDSCSERVPEDSLLSDVFRARLREVSGRGPLCERPVPVGVLLDSLRASSRAEVTLSRARYDVAQDRPLFPASAFPQAGSSAGASTETSAARFDRPVLGVTDHFLSDPTTATDEFAGALFDHIEQGRRAALARASTDWSAYDGVVEPRPGMLPATHSPSKLEDLAACPYRYFLKHVLKVSVHESRDPDEWMTASDLGQILHALFERHARLRMNGDATVDDSAWLEAEVRDLLDAFAATNPPPHEAFVDEARRQIEAAGTVYLHTERENGDRRPHAAEFRFGTDEHADAPPLEIDLSEDAAVSLIGRVDRVDLTSAGRLVVTDFKTGKRRDLSESDLRKLDTVLQWAIYARLAREHFGRQVETSGYLFTSASELGLRREAAPPPDDELDRMLREMFVRARVGFFARNANPYGQPCSFCDFRDVCGDLGGRRDEMRAKACESVRTSDHLSPVIETWNGFNPKYCS